MTEAAYELDDRSLAEIHGSPIDTTSYEEQLSKALAVSGLTLYRHASRLAARGDLVSSRIALHGERAPVSPELPLVLHRLEQAIREKAPKLSIVELLSVYTPMLEDALEHYRGDDND